MTEQPNNPFDEADRILARRPELPPIDDTPPYIGIRSLSRHTDEQFNRLVIQLVYTCDVRDGVHNKIKYVRHLIVPENSRQATDARETDPVHYTCNCPRDTYVTESDVTVYEPCIVVPARQSHLERRNRCLGPDVVTNPNNYCLISRTTQHCCLERDLNTGTDIEHVHYTKHWTFIVHPDFLHQARDFARNTAEKCSCKPVWKTYRPDNVILKPIRVTFGFGAIPHPLHTVSLVPDAGDDQHVFRRPPGYSQDSLPSSSRTRSEERGHLPSGHVLRPVYNSRWLQYPDSGLDTGLDTNADDNVDRRPRAPEYEAAPRARRETSPTRPYSSYTKNWPPNPGSTNPRIRKPPHHSS